jgi:hypothetical protein
VVYSMLATLESTVSCILHLVVLLLYLNIPMQRLTISTGVFTN